MPWEHHECCNHQRQSSSTGRLRHCHVMVGCKSTFAVRTRTHVAMPPHARLRSPCLMRCSQISDASPLWRATMQNNTRPLHGPGHARIPRSGLESRVHHSCLAAAAKKKPPQTVLPQIVSMPSESPVSPLTAARLCSPLSSGAASTAAVFVALFATSAAASSASNVGAPTMTAPSFEWP